MRLAGVAFALLIGVLLGGCGSSGEGGSSDVSTGSGAEAAPTMSQWCAAAEIFWAADDALDPNDYPGQVAAMKAAVGAFRDAGYPSGMTEQEKAGFVAFTENVEALPVAATFDDMDNMASSHDPGQRRDDIDAFMAFEEKCENS